MYEKFCCNYNCLIMRKEITFDEYVQALSIIEKYKRQKNGIDRHNLELQRIKAILIKAREYIRKFDCKADSGRYVDVKYYRNALSYWLRKNTNLSLNKIGELYGYTNHATILNHIEKYENEMLLNPERQNPFHLDAVSQVQNYFLNLNFEEFHEELIDEDTEGSFFISNN